MQISVALLVVLAAIPVYAYLGYPLLLRLLAGRRFGAEPERPAPCEWPSISITVPAYNEEAQIRGLIESLLRLDYPEDRRQILIVSDASTDRTDSIVDEYADHGIELLRLSQRGGKGTAETAAVPYLRGEIVVNTDASIRIPPSALKPLIAQFADPAIGLASGRDISVASTADTANLGESGYVGYEMWVRKLETALGGIVGASGCLYAIRHHLHRAPLPAELSRDFAAALITHEHGYRSVSADEAVCYVPRSNSLHREYPRKVRTMARGLQTLFFKGHLLNPLRHGMFAWMLISHKLCRWLVPWALLLSLAIVVAMAGAGEEWARWVFGGAGATGILAAVGWNLAAVRSLPRLVSVATFAAVANVAALHAWFRVLGGDRDPVWEPTRREAIQA
jgi:cellulose synthase/poly-beta-1,6-N-acetylglucosamine synthase-like glycosyltransferase